MEKPEREAAAERPRERLRQRRPRGRLQHRRPRFVLRNISMSKQCLAGYNSCGSCASEGVACPLQKNVLSSAINERGRVFWNGTTIWHTSAEQFYRPQYIIDGSIGKNSLTTFRTTDESGVLYFDLGRVIHATHLRVNWFQQPAQHWELWAQQEEGFITIKRNKTRRAGRKLQRLGLVLGDGNEVQDVVLHGGTLDGLPLRSFEIRLQRPALGSIGFAIEEVLLFGEWDDEITQVVVGVQIPSVWWGLLSIAGFVCLVAVLSKALPFLRAKILQIESNAKLRCGLYDSRWYAFRCRNCQENWFRHLLQNPRSVVSETAWIIVRYMGSMVVPAIIFGTALHIAQNECEDHTNENTLVELPSQPDRSTLSSEKMPECLISEWTAWGVCDLDTCTRSKRREIEQLLPTMNASGPCKSCSMVCEEECLASRCRLSSQVRAPCIIECLFAVARSVFLACSRQF